MFSAKVGFCTPRIVTQNGRTFATLQWSLANDGRALVHTWLSHLSSVAAVRVQHLTQLSRLTLHGAVLSTMNPSTARESRRMLQHA